MVISIAIQKGGSGKTTTALNLGAALREQGLRVLLVDLDPQCNLTQAMGLRDDPRPGIYEALDQAAMSDKPDIRQAVRKVHGMDFIPASLELAKSELKLVGVFGREALLKNLLAELLPEYDYILIDCPPAVGMLTVNALVASDYVLMPMQAEYLPMKGLMGFMEIYQKDILGKKLNTDLKILGIVLTRFDMRNNMTPQILEILYGMYPDYLLETRIRTNIALAKAQAKGTDVFQYELTSRGAADYRALAGEILTRIAQKG